MSTKKTDAMSFQIFKVIIAGIVAGVVLFAIPFLLFKLFFLVLFLGFLFRIIAGRGFRRHRFQPWQDDADDAYGATRLSPYEGKDRLRDPFNNNPKYI
ncbi:hypothetical protein [Dyadobacter sandarakinus]|uniref:Uncharacterized protein n=1 Tax=Dyadobacter sandarakinus TaxID=2747268 RepID=A0ABX7IA15_9BACT|nr:hypothetical protein [Dyadobacter sandarakinus]QRR01806.1 hypothetical protein HWI92_13255 [Dyadobacter sandarakinus]